MPDSEQQRLEHNKKLVRRLMELLTNPATAEQARDLLTPEYIQHNPNIASGREAIISFAKSAHADKAKSMMQLGGEPTFIAQGDYVVWMQPIVRPDPTRPGQTYILYWFDLWRIENGKIAEHWDGAPKESWSMVDQTS